MSKLGAWLSTPSFAFIEIIAGAGYDTLVMDAEHGTFDVPSLEQVIPFARALGLTVLVKVAAPERAPIQQALDFGADGVVIPHIEGAEHARAVCDFAKVPPVGDRSLAGGRMMGYGGFDANWCAEQNAKTVCLPMIEDPRALDEVAQILELDSVDGVFIGPGDLFVRRGGGGFARTPGDFEDMGLIAKAARSAGKTWVIPAWSEEEQRFAFAEQADTVLVLQEFTALRSGFDAAFQSAGALMRATESRH